MKCFTDEIVREVKYFHPSGRSLPNGSNIQRGGFLNECRQNKNAYTLDESVQHGLAKFKGGVVTFPADINTVQMDSDALANEIKQGVETFRKQFGKNKLNKVVGIFTHSEEEYIAACSVGYFFHGSYLGDNGAVYNERGMSVEVNGLSSRSLVKLAGYMAKLLRQETVLVKDLNTEKIFLVTSVNPDEDSSPSAGLNKQADYNPYPPYNSRRS